ncbi:hypothetical protein MRB53_040260 [Persea americana]|nr:hypothetical protein MRB53_040260 [Persea americana]
MSTKTYITLLAVIVNAVAAQVYTSDGIPYNPSQFQATSYFSPTTTVASLPEETTTLSASDGYGYGSSNATMTGSYWSNSTSVSNTGGILTAPPPTDSMSGGLVTASPTPSASIVSSSSAMNTASQTSSTPTTSSAGATQSGDANSNSANVLLVGLLGLAFSFIRL